jgi:DNA-binding LytR/AlgR family response regulator
MLQTQVKTPYLQLVAACQSALEAKEIMQKEWIDAIFIDINMPDLNGMEFVKQMDRPPMVVFTTAYSEYALEGFKVDAVDYLLKPFGLQDFLRAAQKVRHRYELENPAPPTNSNEEAVGIDADAMYLKSDYKTVRINISDIRYVEGMSEYLKIYLEGEKKPLIVLLSMKRLEERLPSNTFMRIHRSYIINLKKIREVNKNRVVLGEDAYLPIGDLYKENFNDYLTSKFVGK